MKAFRVVNFYSGLTQEDEQRLFHLLMIPVLIINFFVILAQSTIVYTDIAGGNDRLYNLVYAALLVTSLVGLLPIIVWERHIFFEPADRTNPKGIAVAFFLILPYLPLGVFH